MVRLLFGRMAFDFGAQSLTVAARGENHEPGVGDALDTVARIEEHLKRDGIPHESLKWKWEGGKRTDAIIIPLSGGRLHAHVERRRSDRRQVTGRRK